MRRDRTRGVNALRARAVLALVAALVATVAVPGVATASDGELDATFDQDGRVVTAATGSGKDAAEAVLVQPDGKILAAGTIEKPVTATTSRRDWLLVRYQSDGSLDPAFGTRGVVSTDIGATETTEEALAMALQPDGKIVAVGRAGSNHFVVARYDATGALDPTFGSGGIVSTGGRDLGMISQTPTAEARAVAIDPSGKIIVGGWACCDGGKRYFVLQRYEASGTLDPSFATDGIASEYVGDGRLYDLALQPDGKIVAVGSEAYDDATGSWDIAVVRFTQEGSLDPSFDTDGKRALDFTTYTPTGEIAVPSDEAANAVAMQADGKILIAGETDSVAGSGSDSLDDFAVARLNPDGSLDESFGSDGLVTTDFTPPGGPARNDRAEDLVVQRNGGILAVGTNEQDFALARYNPADGSLDQTFGSGGEITTDFNAARQDEAMGVALQSDGNLVAAGFSGNTADLSHDVALARYLTSAPRATSAPTQSYPTITIDDAVVSEGNSGTGALELALTLSGSTEREVNVEWEASEGSATGAADFERASGVARFSPGSTRTTVSVPVAGDVSDEDDETVLVELSSAVNATIADGRGTGTISDDDDPPSLALTDVQLSEGDAGSSDATLTLNLSQPSGKVISVSYETADGTADAASDYASRSGNIEVPVGRSSVPISIPVLGDTDYEPDEAFSVELSTAANATIADSSASATITNDDAEPAPPTTEPQVHDRSISLDLIGHLSARGRVTADDGSSACVSGVPVVLQRRRAGVWATVARTTTSASGRFVLTLGDRPGLYRATAPRVEQDDADLCARARIAKRHLH